MMLAYVSDPPEMPMGTVVSFLCWTVAYVLIIKRGFQDKSFGLPMVLLCGNCSWEFWFSFIAPQSPEARVGNIIWLVLDLVILLTCLLYGRNDYRHPLTRKWFYPLVGLCLLLGAGVQWSLIVGLHDELGMLTGIANAMFGAALLIAMILRRQNMNGQSLWIALAMLVGNACGYFGIEAGECHLPDPAMASFCYVALAGSIILGLVYVGLIFRQCKLDGINPWKRF